MFKNYSIKICPKTIDICPNIVYTVLGGRLYEKERYC